MKKALRRRAQLRLGAAPGSVSFFTLGIFVALALLAGCATASASPYLAKRGERPVSIRIATCTVCGGFAHLYTALENQLFDKYGFRLEQVFIRGSGRSLAALTADEIQFLYCAADATIPFLATGVDVKLVAARAGDLSDRLSRMLAKNSISRT